MSSIFSGTVATFTDSGDNAQAADFSATIDWGDGNKSSGNIVATGSGTFAVSGDHTYLDEGQFTLRVQIADRSGDTAATQSSMMTLEELLPGGVRGTANQRFVSELYRDMLGRKVEPFGLGVWSGMLDRGMSRVDVTFGITQSLEYRTDEVEDMYNLYLHRAAEPFGLQTWVAFLAHGGSQEQLAALIVSSPEYYQDRAGGTSAGFLDAVYLDNFSRSVDPLGRSAFSAAMTAGDSRTMVADLIFTSPEYQLDLVRSIYSRYLDRELDQSGQGTWTALKGSGVSDDHLLARILGEMVDQEFYDKTQV